MEAKTIEKTKDTPMNKATEPNCGNKKVRCKTLIIHGEKYRTTYTKKFANRKKWQKPNEKEIISYIPGTIGKIYAKEGAKVKKGQKILVLEAMKMQNTLEFPMNGVVKKINVKQGDTVPKGFLMVEYQ